MLETRCAAAAYNGTHKLCEHLCPLKKLFPLSLLQVATVFPFTGTATDSLSPGIAAQQGRNWEACCILQISY